MQRTLGNHEDLNKVIMGLLPKVLRGINIFGLWSKKPKTKRKIIPSQISHKRTQLPHAWTKHFPSCKHMVINGEGEQKLERRRIGRRRWVRLRYVPITPSSKTTPKVLEILNFGSNHPM